MMKLNPLEKMDLAASAVFVYRGRIIDPAGRVPENKRLRQIIHAAARELERRAK